ncbi:MAG: arsenate reductase family protein [Parasporobacterium sp.]|nr:arsenate reductase family protein [Parasporobacterium sp.]
MLYIEYPRCGTCKKAKNWLDARNIPYDYRDIKEQNPTAEELTLWHKMSSLPIKRFVNTSGTLYKEMNLKEKLPGMTDEEIITLLSTNGMLVKRPIIVGDDFVTTGFKEEEWKGMLGVKE